MSDPKTPNNFLVLELTPAEEDLMNRAAGANYQDANEWAKAALINGAREALAIQRSMTPVGQLSAAPASIKPGIPDRIQTALPPQAAPAPVLPPVRQPPPVQAQPAAFDAEQARLATLRALQEQSAQTGDYIPPSAYVPAAPVYEPQPQPMSQRQIAPLRTSQNAGQPVPGVVLPPTRATWAPPGGQLPYQQASSLGAPARTAPMVQNSVGVPNAPNQVPDHLFNRHPCRFLGKTIPTGHSIQTCQGGCTNPNFGQKHCCWNSKQAPQCDGYEAREGAPRAQREW